MALQAIPAGGPLVAVPVAPDSGAIPPNQERVLGWDFLRGLCAFAVATYHLLYWQKVTSLHTFGSYGVYMFFVLSGASLAYTYAGRFEEGSFSFPRFLFVRYLRLAPLYILLMFLILPKLAIWTGPTENLARLIFLNGSFLFGAWQPTLLAILPGGWSLGVEAMLYLLFPVLMWSLSSWKTAIATFCVLLFIQVAWIAGTLGEGSYAFRAVDYHHVPAFAAYFMGGCILGALMRRAGPGLIKPRRGAMPALLAAFVLLWALNPQTPGDEIVGWRGVVLGTLCFAMVGLAGTLSLKGRWTAVAQRLGDSTYGVYLIHPVVFFYGLPLLVLGHSWDWPLHARLVMTVLVLIAAFALALGSERFFERPLRDWSKSLRLFNRAGR